MAPTPLSRDHPVPQKPHIYPVRIGDEVMWTYTPASRDSCSLKYNLAAHNFCRRLMGRN